jgi:hypothetical protein
MRRAGSNRTVRPGSADRRSGGELLPGVLCPEAADPFGEAMTFLELESELRSQFEDAEKRRRAITELMAGSSAGGWSGWLDLPAAGE